MDYAILSTQHQLPKSFDELSTHNPLLVSQFQRLSAQTDYFPNIILYGRHVGKDPALSFLYALFGDRVLSVNVCELRATSKIGFERSPRHLYIDVKDYTEKMQTIAFEKVITPVLREKREHHVYIIIDNLEKASGILMQKMLLRTIEEQHHVSFIFITGHYELITDALCSRCLALRCRRPRTEAETPRPEAMAKLLKTLDGLVNNKRDTLISFKNLSNLRYQIAQVQKCSDVPVRDLMLAVYDHFKRDAITAIMVETTNFETFIYGVLSIVCS